jgi:hypothetical protein
VGKKSRPSERAEGRVADAFQKAPPARVVFEEAHLLVHDVVQEDVLVVRVLVLLGEHRLRLHELLAGARVRALRPVV